MVCTNVGAEGCGPAAGAKKWPWLLVCVERCDPAARAQRWPWQLVCASGGVCEKMVVLLLGAEKLP